MQIQRTRHAFKVEAAYFRDVLAGLAELLVVLKKSMSPSILILELLELRAELHSGQSSATCSGLALLPGAQSRLARVHEALVFGANANAGRYGGSHNKPLLHP
jgi:hypothetical protein